MPKKKTSRLIDDLTWCVGRLQSNRATYEAAFFDPDTWKEASRLTSDLYSLFEVIENEAKEAPAESDQGA
jgi:hypothetical protein